MTKTPKRWQDCKPFILALRARGYLGPGDQLNMSAGIYLYMFELWLDGWLDGCKQCS